VLAVETPPGFHCVKPLKGKAQNARQKSKNDFIMKPIFDGERSIIASDTKVKALRMAIQMTNLGKFARH
jgi:hypothetical protein